MALAPEPYLSACLDVLYRATIHARLIAYDGHYAGLTAERSDCLADMMDTVHEIPRLLQRWEECNEPLLRGMLADFDAKWSGHAGVSLLTAYLQIVEA